MRIWKKADWRNRAAGLYVWKAAEHVGSFRWEGGL